MYVSFVELHCRIYFNCNKIKIKLLNIFSVPKEQVLQQLNLKCIDLKVIGNVSLKKDMLLQHHLA